MALPKVSQPTLPILVPSHQRAFRFRPFTVKEEKILLMAKESDDPKVDWLRAVHQVVNNCSVDPELDIDSLATFDLEWLYLKLTAVSVSPTVTQGYYDKEERVKFGDQAEAYTFTIKLDDVHAPQMPEGWKGYHLISVNDGSDAVTMRFPPAVLYTDPDFAKDDVDQILYRSTAQIRTPTQAFNASEFKKEEVVEYFDSWQTKDMTRVWEFINSTPTMKYEIPYVNKFGNDKKIVLTGLSDFFSF